MVELTNITRGFITYHVASIDSLRGWIKETFVETYFIENVTPDNCRSVSTSEAFNINLNILNIVRKACWSNAKTSLQHYEKEVISYKEIKLWNMEY